MRVAARRPQLRARDAAATPCLTGDSLPVRSMRVFQMMSAEVTTSPAAEDRQVQFVLCWISGSAAALVAPLPRPSPRFTAEPSSCRFFILFSSPVMLFHSFLM